MVVGIEKPVLQEEGRYAQPLLLDFSVRVSQRSGSYQDLSRGMMRKTVYSLRDY